MNHRLMRVYKRTAVDVPFQYRISKSSPFRISRLINVSEGGLCFETERPIASNTTIEVLTSKRPDKTHKGDPHLSCRARIRWCRKLERHHRQRYGIGVEFYKAPLLLPDLPPPGRIHRCDFCDEKAAADIICSTHGVLCLCPPCDGHLEAVPAGRVKESLVRFLAGNVV